MQNFTTHEGSEKKEKKKKTPSLEDLNPHFGGRRCTSKLKKKNFFLYLVSYIKYDGMPMRGIHVDIMSCLYCTLSLCQRL